MIILIADDERLVRFTLKSMLKDILEEEYTILEAENGKELVSICKESTPDIVFADIKMPYMDGIRAIEICKELSSQAEFVVISGHSEFEYARKCITLGINDYVLKPIEEDTLAEIVQRLQNKIQLRKKESNSAFQIKVLDYFNYYSIIGDEEFEEMQAKRGWHYRGIGFLGNYGIKDQTYFAEVQKNIIKKIREIGRLINNEKGFYALVYSGEGIPYFLFYVDEGKDQKVLSGIKKICIQEKDDKVAFNLCTFLGDSIKEMYEYCEKIDNTAFFCMNSVPYSIISSEDLNVSPDEREFLQLIEKLVIAWESLDEMSYKEVLKIISQEYHKKQFNFKNIGKNLSYITSKKAEINTFQDLQQYFKDLGGFMYESPEGKESNTIQKVKEYISEFYMNDISIINIADQFGLTPNYLSTLFHRKEGCKFVDYLTSIRMANAKRLLVQNPTASIGDIALMVGYNSQRHFSALFQKATGVVPSAYRKGENLRK